MNAIKLVEATHDEGGWKGTRYKRGHKYFVKQDTRWPRLVTSRWTSVDICGGINEQHCLVVGGLTAWLACRIKQFKLWMQQT